MMDLQTRPDGTVSVAFTDEAPPEAVQYARENGPWTHRDGVTRYLLPAEAKRPLWGIVDDATGASRGEDGGAYKIPRGFRLLSHQPEGIHFFIERETALLADAMGTGKTIMGAVAAAATLKTDDDCVLVLCPAGLVQNWAIEFTKWAPHLSVMVQKSEDFDLDVDVSIVSYDTAKREGDLNDGLREVRWTVLLMDEAHRARGMGSQRHLTCVGLDAERRWLMSGTPFWTGAKDILGLLRLGGHEIGANPDDFAARYLTKGDVYAEADRASRLAQRLVHWVLRRNKDDVLDLEPKTQHIVRADVGEPMLWGKNRYMRGRNLLSQMKTKATVELALEILENPREKLIIFSCFKKAIRKIGDGLDRANVEWVEISGSTNPNKRAQIVEAFQSEGGPRVLIGQIVAAGEGLTLTRSTHVLFNDLSVTPSEHEQAEDRAHRQGQTEEVHIHYVIANSLLDESVWRLLARKRHCASAFMEVLAEKITDEEIEHEMEAVRDERLSKLIRVKGLRSCRTSTFPVGRDHESPRG